MNAKMRKDALQRYIVFRVKLIEFMDINALQHQLLTQQLAVPTPVFRTAPDLAAALRTVQLSWFALLIDKNGTDAIKLWSELFPKHRARIEETWARIEPTWNIIREFRDKAGFHADQPSKFFNARKNVLVKKQEVTVAIDQFLQLLGVILKAEAEELPDLNQAVDDLLDELEAGSQGHYNRAEFKRYLMLSTRR